MNRITTAILLFTFCFFNKVKSQVREQGIGVQLGYAYQNNSRLDLGINYLFVKQKEYTSTKLKSDNDSLPKYKSAITKKSVSSSGVNFSIHGFKNATDFVLGQSIGYTYGKTLNSGLGVNIGTSFFNYTNEDFRINPSIGLSFAEIVYLNYSYSIPLNNKTQSFISPNQVGIIVRYNPAIMKAILNNLK